jgi:hypothetical protein
MCGCACVCVSVCVWTLYAGRHCVACLVDRMCELFLYGCAVHMRTNMHVHSSQVMAQTYVWGDHTKCNMHTPCARIQYAHTMRTKCNMHTLCAQVQYAHIMHTKCSTHTLWAQIAMRTLWLQCGHCVPFWQHSDVAAGNAAVFAVKGSALICLCPPPIMCRVGQNHIYTYIYTVNLVISKPKIPYVHRICMDGSGQP